MCYKRLQKRYFSDNQPQPRYYGKVMLQQLSKDQNNFEKSIKRLFNAAQAQSIRDTLHYIKQKVTILLLLYSKIN